MPAKTQTDSDERCHVCGMPFWEGDRKTTWKRLGEDKPAHLYCTVNEINRRNLKPKNAL